MKETQNNHNSKRLIFFIIIVFLSIFINCIVYYRNTYYFEKRQNDVVVIIEKEIKTSSKKTEEVKYVPINPNRQDSIYADLMALHETTLKHHNEFLQGLRGMINLEFNKIQNEYESQELWVGLITIVFLIFSFYSMFKSDQLEQQSSENARAINDMLNSTLERINKFESTFNSEIDDIQKRGTKKIDELESMKVKIMENFNTSIEFLKKNTTSDVRGIARASIEEELTSFRNEREGRLSTITEKWDKEVEALKVSAEADIKSNVSMQLTDCDKRITNFLSENQNKLATEIERLLSSFDDEKSQIIALIDERVRVVLEANMTTQEDIDAMMREIFKENNPQDGTTGFKDAGDPENNGDK